ncbi:Glycosyl transferase WecB/TagA/CpsF family protein [Streptomyces sp. YIM 130001]|uniref:WecB/TagA/CpsF family glycosyltransferase n=1 Tax=Streptomyces sp. YIM 130001 TaxID=2259644 RepID=UPI000E65D3AE|nr:WecB/TagA/CpsF family glycosyltransferase [Streptomyces sp. YIM 130001]RII08609.1 Glycosyl transferase WecB/TagA/CpsF family protein [Streptomyces sp. YIM 130001]
MSTAGGRPGLGPGPRVSPSVAAATVVCSGIPLAVVTPAEGSAAVVRLAALGGAADVHLCDTYTLALADTDPVLHRRLRTATLNLPDGPGVSRISRLLHHDRGLPAEPLEGARLLLDVFRTGQTVGLRHYVLGSSSTGLDRLTAVLRARCPRARIVGSEAVPHRPPTDEERSRRAERIRAAGAQIVWVALDTPHRDHEAALLARRHPAVYVAAGPAVFASVAADGPGRSAPVERPVRERLRRLAPALSSSDAREHWRRLLWSHPRFIRAALRSTPAATGRPRRPVVRRARDARAAELPDLKSRTPQARSPQAGAGEGRGGAGGGSSSGSSPSKGPLR